MYNRYYITIIPIYSLSLLPEKIFGSPLKRISMKIKPFNLISLTVGLMIITIAFSCGTKTTESPEEEKTPNAVIDTKAPSESKGVGKFTDVKLGEIDPAKADLGKAIFTTKCLTCHKLTAEKFVGPGMEGITKRRTPEWILNMITNPDMMIKTDPVAKKLYEETLVPMAFQNVSDEDAMNILDYLRQNDQK